MEWDLPASPAAFDTVVVYSSPVLSLFHFLFCLFSPNMALHSSRVLFLQPFHLSFLLAPIVSTGMGVGSTSMTSILEREHGDDIIESGVVFFLDIGASVIGITG